MTNLHSGRIRREARRVLFQGQRTNSNSDSFSNPRGLLIGARYKISSDSVQEGGADRGVEGATVSRDDEYRCCHPRCKEREGNAAVPTIVEMNQGNTDENTKTSEA